MAWECVNAVVHTVTVVVVVGVGSDSVSVHVVPFGVIGWEGVFIVGETVVVVVTVLRALVVR